MSSLPALVLIYDIRGFTAASKRLRTADLGAFATGAHRAILDLFVARPPTFVKNLGDGHLLLWELSDPPDPDLVADVVRGAHAAQTAFAAFAAGHGAAGGELPRHVGVGVAIGDVSRSDDYYGVALNLAARLQNLARPEGLAVSPSVFEVAAARDAQLTTELRRAKVHLKGLGSTLVFVKRPFSWARALAPVARLAAVALLPLVYLALCDLGLGVLDGNGVTLFRPVRAPAEVAAAAAAGRRALVSLLLGQRSREGWFRNEVVPPTSVGPARADADIDVWAASQCLYAVLGAPETTPAELASLSSALAAPFVNGRAIEVDGVKYGWPPHPGFPYTEAEPCLWTVCALAAALGREGAVAPGDRAAALERLAWAEAACKTFRAHEDGGWNIFPNQKEPGHHSPYSTTLALLALLEVRAARLPWEGSEARRDELLRKTAAWLAERFLPASDPPGWRRTEDPQDIVSPGLSLQIHALLLRAEAEGLVTLPVAIEREIPRTLGRLVGQDIEAAADAGEFGLAFRSHKGVDEVRNEAINFLWHPWGIVTARLWLARTERTGAAAADRVQARRVLGHLVVDLREKALAKAGAGWTFVAAETLIGLSAVDGPTGK